MSADDSYICHDCGLDTTPCTGKRGCRHKDKWEHYMVRPGVWQDATGQARFDVCHDTEHLYLCIGCLEKRLGRTLTARDFTDAPINNPRHPWNAPRLVDRLTRQ